jgi:hypothetical protein
MPPVDFESIVAISRQDVGALNNRGYAHFYRGDFTDAAADLSRANPTDPYPGLFRCLAQSRAGEPASDLEAAARPGISIPPFAEENGVHRELPC